MYMHARTQGDPEYMELFLYADRTD